MTPVRVSVLLQLILNTNDAFVIRDNFAITGTSRIMRTSLSSLNCRKGNENPRCGYVFPGTINLRQNIHELALELLVNNQQPPHLLNSDILIENEKVDAPSGRSKKRRVTKLQRYERIPAWPLKNGMRLQTISRLPGGKQVASRLEDRYGGGRNCPNIFVNTDDISKTSPFMMLVHHNHSFDLYDPSRIIEKQIIPEGFPSHPHRGMMTITICLKGGLVHRDSLGIKQVFGADASKYCGKHTQALNFGAGVVHELMWDNAPFRLGHRIIRQEIYQIWVDLPSDQRMSNVAVDVLGGDDETPTVIERNGAEVESTTIVIAGSHKNHESAMTQKSNFTVLQVSLEPGKTWQHSCPVSFQSMVIYMRSGNGSIDGTAIPHHCTAFCSNDSEEVVVVSDEKLGADFLFLAGQPLDHNIVARGSVVVDSNKDLADYRNDVKENKLGKPWEATLIDSQWKKHVDRYPCRYDSQSE